MSNADIVSVIEQLVAAENGRDAKAADRLLAPDFTAITRGRGVEQGRAALLDELEHPKNPSERTLDKDVWVRRDGDLAISRSVVSILDGSPPMPVRFRNTHVLSRVDSSWKCVAWQVTKLS